MVGLAFWRHLTRQRLAHHCGKTGLFAGTDVEDAGVLLTLIGHPDTLKVSTYPVEYDSQRISLACADVALVPHVFAGRISCQIQRGHPSLLVYRAYRAGQVSDENAQAQECIRVMILQSMFLCNPAILHACMHAILQSCMHLWIHAHVIDVMRDRKLATMDELSLG